MFLNHRDDGGGQAVGLYLNYGVALALDQAYNHGLTYGSAPGMELFGFVLVPLLPADVSLINFYLSEQRDAVFLGHQLTDLGEHPPSRLVSTPVSRSNCLAEMPVCCTWEPWWRHAETQSFDSSTSGSWRLGSLRNWLSPPVCGSC